MSTATSRVLSILCEWRCWRLQEEWPDLGVSAQDAVSDSAPDLQALSMAGRVGEKPRAVVTALQGQPSMSEARKLPRAVQLSPAGRRRPHALSRRSALAQKLSWISKTRRTTRGREEWRTEAERRRLWITEKMSNYSRLPAVLASTNKRRR